MDPHSITGYHPSLKIRDFLSVCVPSCHTLMVTSVFVYLHEAVLLEAIKARESTQED